MTADRETLSLPTDPGSVLTRGVDAATGPFAFRRLRSAFRFYRASLRADDHTFRHFCRVCEQELSDEEAWLSEDEYPEKATLLRLPRKDCPKCGSRFIPGETPHSKPIFEPLYAIPPKAMCRRLARGEARSVFKIETLYGYPEGHRGARREVIRRFWGRTISTRMETNPRA